jgi:hypothetical protein
MNFKISRLHHLSFLAGTCSLVLHLVPSMKAQPFDAAWISAASGSWTEVFRWNTFGFLPFPNNDAADEFNVLIALDASPTIQLDTNVNIVNLELAAGFIQGSKTITTEDRFLWRGGGLIGGHGQLIAPQKVTMTSGTKTLRSFNVVNTQEAEWLSGDVRSGTNGIFHNEENAVFKTTFDGRWLSDGSRPHGQFRNLGTFYKQESTGTTLIGAEYFNGGKTFLHAGNMKFEGPMVNESLIEANEDTVLEFSHAFESTQDSSILSQNEVQFSSPLYTAKIQGNYSVKNNTILSGKEAVFHPEADLIDIGHTLSIRKGKAYFNSEETVAPQDLILTEKGQILGNDLITVQNHFVWANGASIGGEGTFFNVRLTEMPLIDITNEPRILGNRSFVNFGKLFWTGGDLVMFEKAAIINQVTGTLSIQDNVRSTAFTPNAYPQILNEGLLEITETANNVHLEWDIQSKGRIHLPQGKITIKGGLQMNGGRLTSDDAVLTTPNFVVQKGVINGSLTVKGNMQSFGRLDLQAPDAKLFVSDVLELDPRNELHITITEPETGKLQPKIHSEDITVAQGTLVVHFEENWQPRHGDRIPVLKSNLLVGEFRNVFPLRINESFSVYPTYTSNEMSLLVFEDGSKDIPELNIFDAGEEILLTWPRAFSEHRLQFKSSFADEEWTTYPRTFVNFTTFSKDEPFMLFRLVEP